MKLRPNFLEVFSNRILLGIPLFLWLVFWLLLKFGNEDIRRVIEFLAK